ncbi:hypothetical protein Cflav_PD3794 [Pedosphaera parvula Ellin514]|uniref:Uncharacterized protein n=1 Tax=Pedosphaera parvula (strain Ellin514) TaxID=320771 RepID=B9XGM6_PEDPL|nr:hypothetical protein Cflav_PD3794 [Pedosphaera parvula Ellin514]
MLADTINKGISGLFFEIGRVGFNDHDSLHFPAKAHS